MANSRFPFRLSGAPNENVKVLKLMLSPAAFPDRLVAKASLRKLIQYDLFGCLS